MTFAEGVLRLVRAGVRVDSQGDRPQALPVGDRAVELAAVPVEAAAVERGTVVEPLAPDGPPAAPSAAPNTEPSRLEPGLADLEAAVALVEAGLASRVVLVGFPSWPGLLWQAYQLAEAANVQILPTVTRPGGKVDIVVTRDIGPNG
ncbi:MAG: hypothetical protein ABSA21_10750 [Candidatus Limnocylindrales bacterium]|jgi:hypothetical protein